MGLDIAFIAGLGTGEILMILVVGVLLFGARLPEVGRTLGRSLMELKRGMQGIKDEMYDVERAADAKVEEELRRRAAARHDSSDLARKFQEAAGPTGYDPQHPAGDDEHAHTYDADHHHGLDDHDEYGAPRNHEWSEVAPEQDDPARGGNVVAAEVIDEGAPLEGATDEAETSKDPLDPSSSSDASPTGGVPDSKPA